MFGFSSNFLSPWGFFQYSSIPTKSMRLQELTPRPPNPRLGRLFLRGAAWGIPWKSHLVGWMGPSRTGCDLDPKRSSGKFLNSGGTTKKWFANQHIPFFAPDIHWDYHISQVEIDIDIEYIDILIYWYWYWPVYLYKLHVSSCFGCKIFVSKPSKKGIPILFAKVRPSCLSRSRSQAGLSQWNLKKWRFLVKFPKYHDQNGEFMYMNIPPEK